MVNKPLNLGTAPIDGDDEDIYSFKKPANINSMLCHEKKFVKSRPPPTYIDYYEYEDVSKRTIHHPMKDLKIREDLNRVECVNQRIIEENASLKTYLMKQVAMSIFKGSVNVSLPAYAFNPVSNVSQFMNNFRTCPYYLDRAKSVSPRVDAEERIKLITAM